MGENISRRNGITESGTTSTRKRILASFSKTNKSCENHANKQRKVAQEEEEAIPAFALPPKTVSFSPMVMVKDIDYYTKEEKEASFYNSDDLQDFKQDIRSTLHMMEARMPIDEITFTRKGTESFTARGAELRRTWRTDARRAVFNTQKQLYFEAIESNNNDDTADNNCCIDGESICEAIATAYARTSSKCAQLAYITGLTDERIVRMAADLTKAAAATNEEDNAKESLNPATLIGSRRTEVLLLQQRIQQRREHRRRHLVVSPTAA